MLDEPTNDLDVETLEALEERLAEYEGTLLVVSHDRYFLDSVVTSTLVFEADGQVRRHVGGYSDWLERHEALAVVDEPRAQRSTNRAAVDRPTTPSRKLSYKLQRELDALPGTIDALEKRVAALQDAVSAPEFYRGDQKAVQEHLDTLRAAEDELEISVERWAELEQLAATQAASPTNAD